MVNPDRITHSWNAFKANEQNIKNNKIPTGGFGYSGFGNNYGIGGLSGSRFFSKNDIIKTVITRIALDASMVDFKHLKINQETGNQAPVDSGLINVLTRSANIDQTGRSFLFDLFYSCLDEGHVVFVPVETTTDPNDGSFDILSARVGKVIQWFPTSVLVKVYNSDNGQFQNIYMEKNACIIIESPFHSILNESNQTLRMLEEKIKLMSSQDNKASSEKLNGFIQFPYSTKNESRKNLAKSRKQEIEQEMKDNRYGLAFLDTNETFISAGGGFQNNLLNDVRQLQQDFYNQIGVSEAVLNGTATEQQFLTYYNRSVDIVLRWFTDALTRMFLTKTAVTQGQVIRYYRNPFNLVPVEQLASIADILVRNAIFTPNEFREVTGKAPHPNPQADELYNRNIADANQVGGINTAGQTETSYSQNGIENPNREGLQ